MNWRVIMKYPGGIRRKQTIKNSSNSVHVNNLMNRGMSLEEDINITNTFYLEMNRANIHKKPTPIQIVNVHYPKRSAAVITEAYFQRSSTTDYNGVYKGKYIDFEVKETKNKTLFPLANIHEHQMAHMESIHHHGGITFIIIRFTVHDENYLIPFEKISSIWKDQKNGAKSITYENIKEIGYSIPFSYQARVDYLAIVDALYFSNGGIKNE